MGLSDAISIKEFTIEDVLNKTLIIQMLKYESMLAKSSFGQQLYRNSLNLPLTSLTVEYALNRLTLAHFGYNTTDINIETYRTIFRTYYKSATEYDNDVMSASHYMSQNRCVYYRAPVLEIKDKIPDCTLHLLNNSKTQLYKMINSDASNTVLCAFSLS